MTPPAVTPDILRNIARELLSGYAQSAVYAAADALAAQAQQLAQAEHDIEVRMTCCATADCGDWNCPVCSVNRRFPLAVPCGRVVQGKLCRYIMGHTGDCRPTPATRKRSQVPSWWTETSTLPEEPEE